MPTGNIILETPARGADPGTWDIPVNGNSGIIDGYLGGVANIAVAGSLTLSAPPGAAAPAAGPFQASNAVLRLTGAPVADQIITLPLPGRYVVDAIGLFPGAAGQPVTQIRAAGVGEIVSVIYGAVMTIYCDGTHVRFVDLPGIGTYLDLAQTAIPRWYAANTRSYWLNCDGSPVPASCPILAAMIGPTLPDFRGVSPAYLNQGTGRIASGRNGSVNGDALFSVGGADVVGLATGNIPTIVSTGGGVGVTVTTVPGRVLFQTAPPASAFSGLAGPGGFITPQGTGLVEGVGALGGATAGITVVTNGTAGAAHLNMQPTTIGGIRLIRAA
ncbi:hypothetical protein [Bradyrhizobium cenepequi]|uniref:hypothetical protein n=1 Tax=Bradyrhizobium cenepequi TaxID=2821403 RepID=UPI001CE2D4D2|nr:hypothetical protein [Bradyrhizobium cenepequi]MCA6108095.1 hypothetical protein [Bradyrhizobium cenepequi]